MFWVHMGSSEFGGEVFGEYDTPVDAAQAVAFGAGPSRMAGRGSARRNNCHRAMACARGSRASGNGVWTGLSRCHDPFAGVHTHVDVLFAAGVYLAGTRSSRDARLADAGNHRRFGGGHLVWTPEKSPCISLETDGAEST